MSAGAKISVRLAAAALALGAAIACSPADVTDADTQSCIDYAFAYCKQLQTCSATLLQTRYGTSAVCQSLLKTQCLLTARAPSSAVTAATRGGCTQVLPTWGCDDFLVLQNPPPACQVQAGPLPNGAACAVDQQCQTAYCGHAPGAACGTCQPPTPPGGSCAETQCPKSLVCGGTPPVCQVYVGMGASCGMGVPCVDGLTCVGSSSTTMGMCQQGASSKDAPCVFTGAGCDIRAGLACNAETSTCKTARISQAGGPCGLVGDQSAVCALSACVRGVCVAEPPLGAPCDLTGEPCATGAKCIVTGGGTAGTCQMFGAATCQ